MREWLQLDALGLVISEFRGTPEALSSHVQKGIRDVANIVTTTELVYFSAPVKFVECTLVTLTTPWGRWRYVTPTSGRRTVAHT